MEADDATKTGVERLNARIRNNPLVAALIVAGTVVIAVASFTDAATKLIGVVSRPSPAAARTTLAQMGVAYTPDAFVTSAAAGDVTAVKLFLTAAMDADATGRERSALGAAAFEGRMQVAKLLLDAGASVAARHDGKPAPLVSAAAGGHADMLRLLLEHHPDPATIDAAFVVAIRSSGNQPGSKVEAMRLLAAKGANVAKLDLDTITEALYRNLGDQDVAARLQALHDLGLDFRDLDVKDGKPLATKTLLISAASSGHLSTVQLLLANGAVIDARYDVPDSRSGWTALMLATRERHPEVVATLVAHGANVELRNSDGDNALLIAAANGDTPSVAALLTGAIDVDAKAADGRTAIVILAEDTRWPDGMRVEHVDAMRALLDKGAHVDAKDATGRTALMVAAEGGSTAVVGLLLERGAKADVKDARGLQAIDHARKGNDPVKVAAVVKLLREPRRPAA